MATESTGASSSEGAYEQLYSDWVYWIPGFLLIAVGWGGFVAMAMG